jgi:micrococcal nuclease
MIDGYKAQSYKMKISRSPSTMLYLFKYKALSLYSYALSNMANRKPSYLYKAKLKKAIDEDTIDLIVDAGFYISVHQRFRLKGIDTPEIFGVRKDTDEYKRGMKAKEYVERRFQENGNECIIKSHRTGKYGRWIAEIWFPDSDNSLSQELLDEGLAIEYNG